MKRLIMCFECARKTADKDSPLYLALFGPQGHGLDEPSILVSMPLDETNYSHPLHQLLEDGFLTSVTCDGDCGRELAVSQSSAWFLEQKRILDQMPLQ